jgi:hypothetical protein
LSLPHPRPSTSVRSLPLRFGRLLSQ